MVNYSFVFTDGATGHCISSCWSGQAVLPHCMLRPFYYRSVAHPALLCLPCYPNTLPAWRCVRNTPWRQLIEDRVLSSLTFNLSALPSGKGTVGIAQYLLAAGMLLGSKGHLNIQSPRKRLGRVWHPASCMGVLPGAERWLGW